MVAVEAQFCGVRTLISDKVPEEAKVSGGTLSLPLTCPLKDWADRILQQSNKGEIYCEMYGKYDISKVSIVLANYYEEIVYGTERTTYTG